jgi:hypothetical protein
MLNVKIDLLFRPASQVIVTSYLFPDRKFSLKRLQNVSHIVGKDQLVVDVRFVKGLKFRYKP